MTTSEYHPAGENHKKLYNSTISFDEVPFTGIVRFYLRPSLVINALPDVLTDICNKYADTLSVTLSREVVKQYNASTQKMIENQKKAVEERYAHLRLPE